MATKKYDLEKDVMEGLKVAELMGPTALKNLIENVKTLLDQKNKEIKDLKKQIK